MDGWVGSGGVRPRHARFWTVWGKSALLVVMVPIRSRERTMAHHDALGQLNRRSWPPRLGSGELASVLLAGLTAVVAGGLGVANTLTRPTWLKVTLISLGTVLAAATPWLKVRNDRWARREAFNALLALPLQGPGLLPKVTELRGSW